MNTALQHDTNLSVQDSSEALSLLEQTDVLRAHANRRLDTSRRSDLGQFFTPSPVALFMASLFSNVPTSIELLDAGAGVGALTAAFVAEMCHRQAKPQTIAVTAYEVDASLTSYLQETLETCCTLCQRSGITFSY